MHVTTATLKHAQLRADKADNNFLSFALLGYVGDSMGTCMTSA